MAGKIDTATIRRAIRSHRKAGRTHAVVAIDELERWCDETDRLRAAEPLAVVSLTAADAPSPVKGTIAWVLSRRSSAVGCCKRYADKKACTCLEDCSDYSPAAVAAARGNPDFQRCTVCNNPNCDEPGGEHR